jgi:undecaprenyl diphosphate synthase
MDLDGLDPNRMPVHVACVMDGNGRWATKQGLPRTEGHRAGEEALFDAACGALELGIPYFTVYAFSTENWRRPHEEVRFLLNVIADQLLTRRRDELHHLGVRIRFMGRRDWRVPRWVVKRMDEAAHLTRNNRAMTLTVAFNYGGRAEIVDAVKAIVASGMAPGRIDERTVHRHLYAPDLPDPDLVIRTSGEYRVSNFLLWELAYSELVFTDVLWPDFRRENLAEAVREFQARDRRYGNAGPAGRRRGLMRRGDGGIG